MNRLLCCAFASVLSALGPLEGAEAWDTFSDTWVATDALGRRVAGFAEVGPPRPDRTVGMFYFLWHGAHVQGGPYDVTRILAFDSEAMRKPDSPLWGPLHAPHHWGESIFGYYLTKDEGVLRKHAQMLGDAGVDVVIFDVTNQHTYRDEYMALLRVWSEVRRAGNRTPQIAFLTPFGSPAKVVHELWRDLYEPGHHRGLWFVWDSKPLLLADPDLLDRSTNHDQQNIASELAPGHSLGQAFTVTEAVRAVGGRFPTHLTTNAAVTLTLRREETDAPPLAQQRFSPIADNAWLMLKFDPPLPPGRYRLEAADPAGKVGWWSHTGDVQPDGQAFADGQPVAGDRTLRVSVEDDETGRIRQSFTFRKPQPDYFRGPTQPDMWSWLEVAPQHVFVNRQGEREQMSVGVAQNAVGDRLGSMSEPGARGRSYQDGDTNPRPDAVRWGLNFAGQFRRALQTDPRFIFVTGWNEWIAGRFAEFNGVKLPVMFVDQFDQEHSRDIEPMRGGHGDDYFYQLIDQVRHFKGVRPAPRLRSSAIGIDGRFDDWGKVEPEFHDTIGDEVHRQHRGWDTNVMYTNLTGRNDIVAAKASFGRDGASFYVRTRDQLSPASDADWMVLFLDTDANHATGWLGYDWVVNRRRRGDSTATIERNLQGRFEWQERGGAKLRQAGDELELFIPWSALGLRSVPPTLDFKWADNCFSAGDWSDFTLNGDAAPNDRFNYRARLEHPAP